MQIRIEQDKSHFVRRSCATLDDEMVKNQNLNREVAELRECLKEAINEKCTSCKNWYGGCLTLDKDGYLTLDKKGCKIIVKWRKALEGIRTRFAIAEEEDYK